MIKHLKDYTFPQDLREMNVEELNILSSEIRDFLITNLSKTGGHLASNLGVVELTMALHSVFNTPEDKIVWDVGHQCYVHKILTERLDGFETLRKLDGMSGFPKRTESEYDTFDTGHSSTSISAVAGMAAARDLKGENYETIAVIGDGALTGGLAYEGLNNLGGMKSKSIVILNDNNMSIGRNIGGVSNHLGKLRVSKNYENFKRKIGESLNNIPKIGENLYSGFARVRDVVKYTLVDGILFEELGFTYLGPVDGHNIDAIINQLQLAKEKNGPVFLHVITTKGKGYKQAEESPHQYHGVRPAFSKPTRKVPLAEPDFTYSDYFGRKLVEMAEEKDDLVAISAAMIDGTGLTSFAKQYPKRIFDVGIAEGHCVTFAAGLALSGLRPVVALYSTFLQRALDQVIEDVSLQNLPIIFAIDRGGIVGADGETHHGIFDISFLKYIPNLTVMSPCDGEELEEMLEYAYTLKAPVAIRYPRGKAKIVEREKKPVSQGAQVIKKGKDIEIWAYGSFLTKAMETASILKKKGLDVGIVNPRFVCPLDKQALMESAKRTKMIVTMEDNVLSGGFGETLLDEVKNQGINILSFGWPKQFIPHGESESLYERYGLDSLSMAERIGEQFER